MTAIKRYDYMDIAKGIGILMVVWAHILLTGWTHRMIYAFHMPLFFFLSGMLFKKEKYNTFVSFFVHRAKRLLLPYVIYSVVTWAFWAFFRYMHHDEVSSYFKPLLQTLIAQGSGEFIVHNSALWFIPCLFLVEILYFSICKLTKWLRVIISFGLAALSFILGNIGGAGYWFSPPWNADAAFIALPFYCVGNLLINEFGHERILKCVSNNKSNYIITWLCATVLLFWSSMAFGECSMGSSSYQCEGWIFIIRAFLGCGWLVLLAILIGNIQNFNKIVSILIVYLKWAGKKSLDIMCLHIPLKGVCMIFIAKYLHSNVDKVSDNYFYSLFAFLMTMIGCWLIIRFIVQKVILLNSSHLLNKM